MTEKKLNMSIARGKNLIHLPEYKSTSVYLHDVTEIRRKGTELLKNTETGKSFFYNQIVIKHKDGSETEINLYSDLEINETEDKDG